MSLYTVLKGEKERYLLGQNTTLDFLGKFPLSSYKTTLKQHLNGEKWDLELGHLSAMGWAMLFFVSSAWSVSGWS